MHHPEIGMIWDRRILGIETLWRRIEQIEPFSRHPGNDFSGGTVTGPTSSNITWTDNGVSDPGDITAVDVYAPAPPPFALYDT